jgi:hypothetical protein
MKKLQWQGSTKRWVAVLCAAVGAVALLIAANKVLAAGCDGTYSEVACVTCCGHSQTCKAWCSSIWG